MEIVSVIEGVVFPFVASFLKGQHWDKNVKFVLSMGFAVAVAAVSLVISGDLTWNELLANSAIVWSVAQANYQLYFKDTAVETSLAEFGPWSKVA